MFVPNLHRARGWRVKNRVGQIICTALLVTIGCAGRAGTVETESAAMSKAVAANKAKDYATSMAIYRKLADDGSAAAPAMIGLLYFAGAGVPRDTAKACDFFAISEKKADPNGTELLADCFFKGEGRVQDYTQSARLYEEASARGVAIADCALGNQYLGGLGVEKDQSKAAVLCRKSADRGVANAQTDLGQMYLMGQGVEKNPSEAALWFQKAADQGNANAAFLLGTMYWNGDGVERNHEQAGKRWYLSAERGNTSAPARLAKYYFAASITADKRIVIDPALKAAYWGTLAAHVDPSPAAQSESQKLVDLLLNAAPSLKPKVEAMLATSTPPSY
jgi:TPR repeat protein